MALGDEWVVRDLADLGRAIRHYRNQQHVLQEELAAQADIHRSYLSAIERGKATEQTDRLFRVLRRLGLEIIVRPRSGG